MALAMWKKRVRVDENGQMVSVGYGLNEIQCEDRLSKLPETLIHHIFSFLPTVDSVRTCVLSKNYRSTWHSIPTLQFSDSDIFINHRWFDEFVTQCLKQRSKAVCHIPGSAPVSFKLDAFVSKERGERVTRWLRSTIINNIRELDLGFKWSYEYTFRLKSLRSLTRLKLHGGFNLKSSKLVNFPCLKYLSIDDVYFYNISISDLLSGCPNLETLSLINVGTGKEVLISGSNLKSVEVKCEYSNVVIKAVNLESLVIFCEELNSTIDFSACTLITDLTLNSVSRKFVSVFEDQVSKLDHLERFTLSFGETIKAMDISNAKLKCFSLLNECNYCFKFKLTTDTPNLVLFNYRGNLKFSASMKNPNRNLEGQFFLNNIKSHKQLINFLSDNDCSWNIATFFVDYIKVFILPGELKKTCNRPPIWSNLKHVKIMFPKKLIGRPEVRESLKWLFPSVETTSIQLNHHVYDQ